MRNYILGRLFRSIISIFIVMSIVVTLVYALIPRETVVELDGMLSKLKSNPDAYNDYLNRKYVDLGYIEYATQAELCQKSENPKGCALPDSEESKQLIANLEDKGYTVKYTNAGSFTATRDYTVIELVLNFYKKLLAFDHPGKVQDPENPDLKRKIYFALDYNKMPSLQCSGCEHRFLIYLDSHFPFIHQNFININMGNSYPTFNNQPVINVITEGQGELAMRDFKFETGEVISSAIDFHSLTYKPTANIDKLDRNKFLDNYSAYRNNYTSPSMIGVSYTMGLISMLFTYLIALPFGVLMARKKDKFIDRLGIVYINIMIAVPSLAFIFFFNSLGHTIGLPDKFPILGFGDIRSYILPVAILALLGTAGLMIWVRRFMIDQVNSDYVKFARAKGLSEANIFNKHILKNAIIPLVNGLPGTVILAIGGAVITETVFAIPGMGKMFPDAIAQHNNAMIVALTFIFTSLAIISLLLGDLLMVLVDPRIQLSSKKEAR